MDERTNTSWHEATAARRGGIRRCRSGHFAAAGLVLIMLPVLIALAGCMASRAPSPGLPDPYPAPINDPQITVVTEEFRPWLGFHPAVIVKDGERPMRVEVPVRNLAQRQLLIDYRILFYNEDGEELQPTMGWRMQALEPKQTVRLRANAMSTEAEDYRVEVRRAR